MEQLHVNYKGRVQGIGFRYTVLNFAVQIGLKGWVKNLSDGRVEMVVQGDEVKIRKFIEEIDNHFEGQIQNKDILKEESIQNLDAFRIHY